MPRHTQQQLLALLSPLESFNEFTRDPQVTALFVDGKTIEHIESLVIMKDGAQALQVYALAKDWKQDELRNNDAHFRGGDGRFYLAQNAATGQWVGLKECFGDYSKKAYAVAKELLKDTDTVISVLTTGVAKNNYTYVVMERAKVVFEGLRAGFLTAGERKNLLKQTLEFTKTLATHQAAHTDVKPRNFMLSYDHQLKVCDLDSLIAKNDFTGPNSTYLLNVFSWLYHPSFELIEDLHTKLTSIHYRPELPQSWYEEVLNLFMNHAEVLEAGLEKSLVSNKSEKPVNPASYNEMHLFIFKLDKVAAELKKLLAIAELRKLFFELIKLFAEPICNTPLVKVEIDKVKKMLMLQFQTPEEAFTGHLQEIISSKDSEWLIAIIKLRLDLKRYNFENKALLDLVVETKDESFMLRIQSEIPGSGLAYTGSYGVTLLTAIKENFDQFAFQLIERYQALGKAYNAHSCLDASRMYDAITHAIQFEKVHFLPILLKIYAVEGRSVHSFMATAIRDKKYKVVAYFATQGDVDVEENQSGLEDPTKHYSMLSLAVSMNDFRLVEILLMAKRAPMLNQASVSPLAVAIKSQAEPAVVLQLLLVSTENDLRKIFPPAGAEFKQWTKLNKALLMDKIIAIFDEQFTAADKRNWLKKVLTPGTAIHLAIAKHDSTIPFNFSLSGVSGKTNSILRLEEMLQKLAPNYKPA